MANRFLNFQGLFVSLCLFIIRCDFIRQSLERRPIYDRFDILSILFLLLNRWSNYVGYWKPGANSLKWLLAPVFIVEQA